MWAEAIALKGDSYGEETRVFADCIAAYSCFLEDQGAYLPR